MLTSEESGRGANGNSLYCLCHVSVDPKLVQNKNLSTNNTNSGNSSASNNKNDVTNSLAFEL